MLDIVIGSSTNQQDFPPLTEGLRLLHGMVIHCLPHGQIFKDPVFIIFDLPLELASRTEAWRLSIFYSGTDMLEAPRWKKFQRTLNSSSGDARFVEDADESPNVGMVLVKRAEIVLMLRHFCVFAVVIDGRKEKVQKASVKAFMKICEGADSLAVDVLILVGCDEEEVVSVYHCS
jgi:hypothetical protein